MDSSSILSIPETQPEKLFPNSESEAKLLYRKLMLEWHPDHNNSNISSTVSAHIQKLYSLAINKIKSGTWMLSGALVLNGEDGKERTVKYRKKRSFELGEMVYGDRVLCYVVRPEFSDIFGRAVETIKHSFTYKDDKMKEEMEKYLPVILDTFKTKEGSNVLVLSKTPDTFLLQDVIDACNGAIDPKHVAWITSSFLNIACYLRLLGLTHNAFSTTNCFISPKFHSGMLFGGWWYSQVAGKKLIALPKASINIAPYDISKNKEATLVLDLCLIRQLGLDCLGDPTGINLLHSDKVPKPMLEFLRGTSEGNAVKDYKHWQETSLISSFGKRRFVEMDIKASDIFKE